MYDIVQGYLPHIQLRFDHKTVIENHDHCYTKSGALSCITQCITS